MLKLSDKWGPVLRVQPETGMGYWIASVFLRDGTRVDRVTIVGGTISEVNGSKDVPFKEEDITDIRVTHGK